MWHMKKYDELELDELEQILGMRQDIFILEQESFFRDIDGNDKDALHIFKKDGPTISAYCRLEYTDIALISRVVVNSDYRGAGLGRELFQKGVEIAEDKYPNEGIKITAMSYLTDFYESFGFKVISEEYDIAGHGHIDMERIP